jgi:AcrR family transcriptional regulator
MDDVADAAEVGKGTLYRYFRDKEELFTGLLEHALKQYQERIDEEVAKAMGARRRLEALVGAIIAYFDEHPHLMGLIQRGEITHEGDQPFLWSYARVGTLRKIANLFEEGRIRGEFEVRDPSLTSMMLLGGIRTVIRAGSKPRPADLPKRIVDNLLSGAAAPPAQPPPPAIRHGKANGKHPVPS